MSIFGQDECATKNCVDSWKPHITIWEEGRGQIAVNEYKLAFGDAMEGHPRRGYPMAAVGWILRMALVTTLHDGNTDATLVCIIVNGEPRRDYTVTKQEGEYSATQIFPTTLQARLSNVINFLPKQTDPLGRTICVSALLEIDI